MGERGDQHGAATFPWPFIPAPGPGERRADYFTWPDVALAGLRFPYFALRGREPGPTVLVISGIHGGEYPGPLGAIALGRELDPATLRGAVLILPLVNLPAFWARAAFVTPGDGRNLNRAFPGKPAGTISEVLAHRLLTDVVEPADAVIDLHSGDIFEALADHTGHFQTADATVTARNEAMVAAFGLPYAGTYPAPTASRSLVGNTALRGKAAIIVEVGGNGLVSPTQVATVQEGVREALRALGLLPRHPARRADHADRRCRTGRRPRDRALASGGRDRTGGRGGRSPRHAHRSARRAAGRCGRAVRGDGPLSPDIARGA